MLRVTVWAPNKPKITSPYYRIPFYQLRRGLEEDTPIFCPAWRWGAGNQERREGSEIPLALAMGIEAQYVCPLPLISFHCGWVPAKLDAGGRCLAKRRIWSLGFPGWGPTRYKFLERAVLEGAPTSGSRTSTAPLWTPGIPGFRMQATTSRGSKRGCKLGRRVVLGIASKTLGPSFIYLFFMDHWQARGVCFSAEYPGN